MDGASDVVDNEDSESVCLERLSTRFFIVL